MYIFTLWLRYLKSRRQAYICIICVMLGVATLIVVNSVMSGFSTKLEGKLHDMQSDVVIESTDPMYGFPMTAEEMMERIRRSPVNPHIKAMAPSVELFALMQFRYNGRNLTKSLRLIGVDPAYQKEVGGFAEYLEEPERRAKPSFEIGKEAMERFDFFHPPGAPLPLPPPRPARAPEEQVQLPPIEEPVKKPLRQVKDLPPIDAPPAQPRKPKGVIIGYALAAVRDHDPETGQAYDRFILERGDTVTLYTVGCESMEPVWDEFIVCDFSKTGMSDIDSSTIYVPLDYLQHLRTMEGRVNTLQIKLHDASQCDNVKELLQKIFPAHTFHVSTWRDKQGVLLSAIAIERGILNLLLFLIIGVAGFGILAIFSMIVTEKTRDIGILKSLGASNRGVLLIFLGYGLLLGLVGAGLGTGLGLVITEYINEIEHFISRRTGAELFNRDVYYFSSIPTDIRWQQVLFVNAGAIFIAVIFSIWPAWRASRLHPVQALRHE